PELEELSDIELLFLFKSEFANNKMIITESIAIKILKIFFCDLVILIPHEQHYSHEKMTMLPPISLYLIFLPISII
ncbi:MAG: hypothetical protein ACYDG2_07915, partial [Ruminiclostridium sp.]